LEITVEDLKKMLGLYNEKKKEYDYPRFFDFENRVLKPAKEQIELHTPHRLDYQKVGGRGPAGIRFIKFFLTFKNKKKSQEAFDSLRSTITQINGETVEQPSFNWSEKDAKSLRDSQNYFDEKANPF
jgi:plasmid replication initiation protein